MSVKIKLRENALVSIFFVGGRKKREDLCAFLKL